MQTKLHLDFKAVAEFWDPPTLQQVGDKKPLQLWFEASTVETVSKLSVDPN